MIPAVQPGAFKSGQVSRSRGFRPLCSRQVKKDCNQAKHGPGCPDAHEPVTQTRANPCFKNNFLFMPRVDFFFLANNHKQFLSFNHLTVQTRQSCQRSHLSTSLCACSPLLRRDNSVLEWQTGTAGRRKDETFCSINVHRRKPNQIWSPPVPSSDSAAVGCFLLEKWWIGLTPSFRPGPQGSRRAPCRG